jgi:enamine deaminase RidA (YjgF/YER057c/UK114 family)
MIEDRGGTAPEERLAALGLRLPHAAPVIANHVWAVASGSLLFCAGHGPYDDDAGNYTCYGKVGADVTLDEARDAARLVALNLTATVKRELGELNRVTRIVNLRVFVDSTPDFFTEHHLGADAASDLFIAVFGDDRGRHARSAIGVASIGTGISVEIEGVFSFA